MGSSGVDKSMTIAEAVGQIRDGMTIGIGGWGSRRKPMALVRAIARSGLRDLTVVSYGGPDVGLLVAAGNVSRVVCGFVTLDSIPLEPHFRRARREGRIRLTEVDEGMLRAGLSAAAQRLPFLPIRAGLASDVLRVNPELRCVVSPYDDAEELVAMPALTLDVALVHMNRADQGGNAQYLGPDPYFDDLFCLAARRRLVSCERSRRPGAEPAAEPGHGRRRHRDPARRALHQLRAGLRPGRGVPAPLCAERRVRRGLGRVQRGVPQR